MTELVMISLLCIFSEVMNDVIKPLKGSDWKVLVVDQLSMRMIAVSCDGTDHDFLVVFFRGDERCDQALEGL